MADPVTTINTATETVNAISLSIDNLKSALTTLVASVFGLIGVASTIAAHFPKPPEGSALYDLHGWVNKAACNVKHAENRDPNG